MVYEDDDVYVVDDADHYGLAALLNDAGVDDDLRYSVHMCNEHAGRQHHGSTLWDVSRPLVIAPSADEPEN